MLRDMGLEGINVTDGRRLEVVATGLPLERGLPLAIDCTMVSALHGDGSPWAHADTAPGTSIRRAEATKRDAYPELVLSDSVHLLVLACEVGGRWSDACATTLAQLATARARACPTFLRASARSGFLERWWRLLSCAQQDRLGCLIESLSCLALEKQDSLAATLVDDSIALLDGVDAALPFAADVALDADA